MVSHEAAAALERLTGFPPRKLSLLVPHGCLHTNPLAVVHQTRLLPSPVFVDGLPCTPVDRTLCDLAKVAGPLRVGRALDDAVASRQVSLLRVQRTFLDLARAGRPGIDVMRKVIGTRVDGYVPTGTQLERELDAIIITIPGAKPLKELQIGDRVEMPQRVDRFFVDPPLIVEADGRLWHARFESQNRDKARDRRALKHGFPTARYGWYELRYERDYVREELCEILGR